MALYKRVTLLFLSILCSIFHCMAQDITSEADAFLTNRCAFEIDMEKGHISGIMITKENDNSIIGSMINEFGVSALSFCYDKRKNNLKLQDVVSFLNKWYIKRVLKADLTLCLHVLYDVPFKKNNNYELLTNEEVTVITNTKHHISYTFHPLEIESEYETVE